jgi:hypothetical protein
VSVLALQNVRGWQSLSSSQLGGLMHPPSMQTPESQSEFSAHFV